MDIFIICEVLMIIQLALLLLHQMDSTYFKEWEMVPYLEMGYTHFFVFTIIVTVIQIAGILFLIDKNSIGVFITIFWGCIGLVVPTFHSYHYLIGTKGFRNFWSAFIIYLTFINSVLLIVYGFKAL